jgi:hypothetical protein
MQSLTSFNPVRSVGGVALMATSFEDGFHFAPFATQVGPWYMEVEKVETVGNKTTVRFSVPIGGDAGIHQVFVLPGTDPTRGALALMVPRAGHGLLFAQDRPWHAVRVEATSTRMLAHQALSTHDQYLVATGWPPGLLLPRVTGE